MLKRARIGQPRGFAAPSGLSEFLSMDKLGNVLRSCPMPVHVQTRRESFGRRRAARGAGHRSRVSTRGAGQARRNRRGTSWRDMASSAGLSSAGRDSLTARTSVLHSCLCASFGAEVSLMRRFSAFCAFLTTEARMGARAIRGPLDGVAERKVVANHKARQTNMKRSSSPHIGVPCLGLHGFSRLST